MERRHLVRRRLAEVRIVVGQIGIVTWQDARHLLVGGIDAQRVRGAKIRAREPGTVQRELRGAVEEGPAPSEEEREKRGGEPHHPRHLQIAEGLVLTDLIRGQTVPPVPGRRAGDLELPHDGVRQSIGQHEEEHGGEQCDGGGDEGDGQARALAADPPAEDDGDLPREAREDHEGGHERARPQRQVWPLAADDGEVGALADGVDEGEGQGRR